MGARIVDVGCGRGRYLAALASETSRLQFAGVDPAESLLAELPAPVQKIRGGLLNLPLDDGSFDGAMTIEALEHALIPEQGVAELCRVVRSGGRVMLIDKNREKQPLSHSEPWERWFAPDEVSGWLANYCDDVKCAAIPHAGHVEATGLFLCWTGRRR
jgi:malonyl-CoA O-methyltransferase